jgi:hypothetical protein
MGIWNAVIYAICKEKSNSHAAPISLPIMLEVLVKRVLFLALLPPFQLYQFAFFLKYRMHSNACLAILVKRFHGQTTTAVSFPANDGLNF